MGSPLLHKLCSRSTKKLHAVRNPNPPTRVVASSDLGRDKATGLDSSGIPLASITSSCPVGFAREPALTGVPPKKSHQTTADKAGEVSSWTSSYLLPSPHRALLTVPCLIYASPCLLHAYSMPVPCPAPCLLHACSITFYAKHDPDSRYSPTTRLSGPALQGWCFIRRVARYEIGSIGDR